MTTSLNYMSKSLEISISIQNKYKNIILFYSDNQEFNKNIIKIYYQIS